MKKQSEKLQTHAIEFFQIVRSFAIRYLSHLKQKSHPSHLIEQVQINLSKILNHNDSKQSVLSKLLSLQLKGDYQQVIALTCLQDLSKWSKQYYEKLIQNKDDKLLLESILQNSIKLMNSQQQFHTIVPKQNDLLRQLLITPHVVNNQTIQNYRIFYRKLKEIKEFYPQVVKENQKILFLKTIQESIEVCAKYESIKTLQFIFSNIFAELQVIDENHQYTTSRLKLIKKIVKHLWYFHEDIIYQSAFLVMKFSQNVIHHPHLFNSVMNLYEDLMPLMIRRLSPALLITFNHLILNNIKKILQQKLPHHFLLETLLNSLTEIFKSPFIEYFMKNYDANFMEESICQSSLSILFQFVENRANQKKYEYQIFKKYLKKATDNIRIFLNQQQGHIQPPSQKLIKFYQVKKKQYLQIVQDMNQKPKKIFKKLQSISNKDIKQQIMKKYARIAKKSSHLQNKKMIDVFAANNPISEELFSEYVNLLFSNLSKDVNLQQFLRFFSSNFFLNGESQQILRVLDKITVLYYNHQPSSNKVLKNSDSTYTYANAIILLNTDLHNPQNQQKMSLESFCKICKKINNGQDLPTQILNSTYTNIKKNKINTFRQKFCMFGISPTNFVQICNKEQQNLLNFFDTEMKMLTKQNFYDFWIYDLLVGIIDQRETMKLEQLIQRFVYDDNSYECETIQLIRKLSKKKPHIPLHALEKILQHANFKNSRTSEKTISYLWLSATLVQNFSTFLPTNVICELLILTWRIRSEIKDDMYLRQRAQTKRIRRMVKQYHKRQNKKSIMDMFSSFLVSKDQDSQPDVIQEFNMAQTNIKKMNHKVLTQKIFDVLIKSSSNSSHSKICHRAKAIQFFVGYLRNDEQKIFEQFLSLLYLIFHLLYRFNKSSSTKNISEHQSISVSGYTQSPSKRVSVLSSSLNLSSEVQKREQRSSYSHFEETVQDLFYQLLGLKQSSITKRIQNLKKKDMKKYQTLQNYSQFWVLKILISKIGENKITGINESINKEDRVLYLLNKSIEFVEKTDKQIFLDLVYQFEQKSKQIFSQSISRSQNSSEKKIVQYEGENKVNNQLTDKLQTQNSSEKFNVVDQQQKNSIKNENQQAIELNQQNQVQQNQNIAFKKSISEGNYNISSHQQDTSEEEELIQQFIFNYKRVILQFYVNCERVIGKQEMKKAKQWKWLSHMQKMIKQVVESYQQKQIQKRNKEQELKQHNLKQSTSNKNIVKNDNITQKESEQNSINTKILQAESNQTENNKQLAQTIKQQQPQNAHYHLELHKESVSHVNDISNQNQISQKEMMQKINKQLSNQQINVQQQNKSNINKTSEQPIIKLKNNDNWEGNENNQELNNQNKQNHQNEAKLKQQPLKQNKQIEIIPQQAKIQKTLIQPSEPKHNGSNTIQSNNFNQTESREQQKMKLLQMMKQEEQELRKLQELYQSQDTINLPVYML